MRVKLGEVFDLQMGKTPARNTPEYWNGTYKWVSIGDLSNAEKYISATKECISDIGVEESGIKPIPKDTVIMSFKLSIGKTAITTEAMYTNEAIMAFINNGKYEVDPHYLYHMFSGMDWAEGTNKAVMGLTLNKATLAQKEIEIHDIGEQQEIAVILDKVSGLIAMRKKQLQKLDDLVKSRFVEMFGDPELNPFGWECSPLSNLVSVEPQNGLYKPQSDYVEDSSGVPILRIDAFYNGKVTDFQSLRRLICSDTERERYLLRENDIVINRVNSIEYLGKCAHIRGMLEDTVFESNMMRFHLNESIIDAGFAVHLLCTQYIYKQILNRAKKAVNQASINQGDVMSFQMLVPPLTLQKQFVTFVEQIDKSKSTIQQSLDKLELLKKALMQKYFG